MDEILPESFFRIPTLELAKALLGKLLVHIAPSGQTAGIIVETEAYIGPQDKAAHSYNNLRTKRTEVMFGPAGHAYIYTIYGIHNCFNVVSGEVGCPEAILIRALEPVTGIELMKKRRRKQDVNTLTNGPGNLTQAMGITKQQYGWSLTSSSLYLTTGIAVESKHIVESKRIGIGYAEEAADFPWRFYIKDNKFVSK